MKVKRDNNFGCKDVISNLDDITKETLSLVSMGAYKDCDQDFICDYCRHSINSIIYTEDEQKIYNFYMNKVFKSRYFDDQIDESDIRTTIQYLALKKIKDLNLTVHFEILPDYLYTLKYGLMRVSSCKNEKNGSSVIYLRNSLFNRPLTGKDYFDYQKYFDLLELVYHEIIHSYQNHLMCEQLASGIESKNVLMWIKENIIDDYDGPYYFKNYKNMYSKCEANVKSKFMTLDAINDHFSYFGLKFIKKEEQDALDYYYSTLDLQHLDPKMKYKKENLADYVIDSYIDEIALNYPNIIYEKLGIQYQRDGKRRSWNDLTSEYYTKKLSIQSTYKEGTKEYCDKMESLRDLYDYLIWSAKEKEAEAKHNQDEKIIKKIKHK
jgi:hypothetical protein